MKSAPSTPDRTEGSGKKSERFSLSLDGPTPIARHHLSEGPDERNRYLAEQLILDAGSAGIPPNEIEEDYPDLTSVVAGAIEAAADPDAKRFARQEE